MNSEFPELHDFFGAYFHQDWTIEHETAEEVIDAFLYDSGREDLIEVRREIEELLMQKKEESALRAYLLRELSFYYCYWDIWDCGESWLRHVANRLDAKIESQ